MRSHEGIAELTGAYALNAVDDYEKKEVEEHIETCGICRREIEEYTEVAASMALSLDQDNDNVWAKIEERINNSDNNVVEMKTKKLAKAVPIWRIVSIAAVFIFIVALAVSALAQNNRISDLRAELKTSTHDQAIKASETPGAKKIVLTSSDKSESATMIMRPDNSAYLIADSLPALNADQTYQMWSVANGEKISVAVLGSSPQVVMLHVPTGTSAIAITVEKSNGVIASTKQPVVSGLAA